MSSSKTAFAKKPVTRKAAKSLATDREKAVSDLMDALLSLKTKEEAKRFLSDICTPKEITDLADRWWIARLLDEGGRSYRDVHALTRVSLTTIGRVARFLQQEPHHGYRLVIDRLNNQRRSGASD